MAEPQGSSEGANLPTCCWSQARACDRGCSLGISIKAFFPHGFMACMGQLCVNSTQHWKKSLKF